MIPGYGNVPPLGIVMDRRLLGICKILLVSSKLFHSATICSHVGPKIQFGLLGLLSAGAIELAEAIRLPPRTYLMSPLTVYQAIVTTQDLFALCHGSTLVFQYFIPCRLPRQHLH